MGDKIRSSISKSNKYWISPNRYRELKYFCLQYNEWKELYNRTIPEPAKGRVDDMPRRTEASNPTEWVAIVKAEYAKNMKMVEQCSKEADEYLADYIFKGVTENLAYEALLMQYDIPCCRDTYYDRYRKFFWILNTSRR